MTTMLSVSKFRNDDVQRDEHRRRTTSLTFPSPSGSPLRMCANPFGNPRSSPSGWIPHRIGFSYFMVFTVGLSRTVRSDRTVCFVSPSRLIG